MEGGGRTTGADLALLAVAARRREAGEVGGGRFFCTSLRPLDRRR